MLAITSDAEYIQSVYSCNLEQLEYGRTLMKNHCHVKLAKATNLCISQILSNQLAIRENFSHCDKHIHNLRVAIRKLNTTLKFLKFYSVELSPKSNIKLDALFHNLGLIRDKSNLIKLLDKTKDGKKMLPYISAEIAVPKLKQVLNKTNTNSLNLALKNMSVTMTNQSFISSINQKAMAKIDSQIINLIENNYRLARKSFCKKDNPSEKSIHTIRKKLKFVKYSLEEFQCFYGDNDYQAFYKLLTESLDNLGSYLDKSIALKIIENSNLVDTSAKRVLKNIRAKRMRAKRESILTLDKLFLLKLPKTA